MGSASPRDHLMKLLEPVVSAEGLDLVKDGCCA